MDAFSLRTASTYVNNLLLARGLLQNGKAIEFAKPKSAEGGTEATMVQIINVVHDLILRRDREQEHHESLVQTIRSLRTESNRLTTSNTTLQQKNDGLTRQLALSQSQERASTKALRAAESSARALREEMLRLKTTVAQVRTACANDVRKRDVQISKLKGHLVGQQRGNKTGLVGESITITPGATTGTGARSGTSTDEDDADGHDEEWSLRRESNEMLTNLCHDLGEENGDLMGLMRSTLDTLRDIQGITVAEDEAARPDPTNDDAMVQSLPTSYEHLASEMHNTLASLRTLLTNPNFVSVDEVTIREEEIARLRGGFEQLECRWREAIALMGSWRERMANGGDTVNLEELKEGLGLGVGAGLGASVMMARPLDARIELSGIEEESSNAELDVPDFDSAEEEDEVLQAPSPDVVAVAKKEVLNGRDFGDVRLPPTKIPLKDADGNAASPKRKTPRATRFDGQDEENAGLEGIEEQALESKVAVKPTASRLPRKTTKRPRSPERTDIDRSEKERLPKLTVQEKLALTQEEAEAALGSEKISGQTDARLEGEAVAVKVKRSPSKKARMSGRPKRRKSTLTRDEMADLLAGLIE